MRTLYLVIAQISDLQGYIDPIDISVIWWQVDTAMDVQIRELPNGRWSMYST